MSRIVQHSGLLLVIATQLHDCRMSAPVGHGDEDRILCVFFLFICVVPFLLPLAFPAPTQIAIKFPSRTSPSRHSYNHLVWRVFGPAL